MHDNASRLERATFFLILASGFCLRFYHLEVPSMWWDEILVPIMARHPLDYLLRWSYESEMHPPFFHLLIKLVMQAGASDFALRLVPALAGAASIIAIYVFGKRIFNGQTALIAAFLLAASPLHIQLSREVRPYSIMILLFLFSMNYFIAYLRRGEPGDLYKLIACNLFLFMLHFIAFPVVGAEFLIFLSFRLKTRSFPSTRHLAVFSICSAISAAPALLLVLHSLVGKTAGSGNFASILHRIQLAVGANLFQLDVPYAAPAIGVATLLGAAVLARKDPAVAFAMAGLLAFPLLIILFGRTGLSLAPWHISILLPLILYFAAAGLAFVARPRALLCALLLVALAGLSLNLLTDRHDAFYGPAGQADVKGLARTLPSLIAPGQAVVWKTVETANGANWYLDRYLKDNYFKDQNLDAQSGVLSVFSINALGQSEDDLLSHFGSAPERVTLVGKTPVRAFGVPRSPGFVIADIPYHAFTTAEPKDIYAKMSNMSGLTLDPTFGFKAIPTRNNALSHVEYEFRNQANAPFLRFTLLASYRNTGQDNIVRIRYKFDDEEYQTLFESRGRDLRETALLNFERSAPYKTLRLRFELSCALKTPSYPGDNRTRAAFKDFRLLACTPETEYICHLDLIRNVLPIGYLERSTIKQRLVSYDKDGLRERRLDEPGWSMITPNDVKKQGAALISVSAPPERAIFYPRLMGEGDYVRVSLVDGEKRKELYALRGGKGKTTSMAMQVPIYFKAGNKGDALIEIMLAGTGAQLWSKDGVFFFDGK